ncbi:MAG TPA: septum formation inhibitor Maf [Acidimicrobiaceae bacterium]|nr:septum formation inhibitor Maf [Acidimicrobiaceae bacterium]
MSGAARVVLASSSPRRRELLERLGLTFRIASPDIDETPLPGESPIAYVTRLAVEKAHAVAAADDELVIAADTTVEADGLILAKPNEAADAHAAAVAMLRRLSGRTHATHTGVAVRLGDRTEHEVVTTEVTFVTLSDADIEWYIATGEPLDKAGAYAVQGAGGVFVERIDGSVSNVVGLPLHTVARLAAGLGVSLTR